MYIDISQHIEDVKTRLGETSKTYKAALGAFTNHIDLRAYLDDSNVVKLCGFSVNPFVDEVDIERGQEIYAHLFMKDEGQRIYSDPPRFLIGSSNSGGFGIHPVNGWEEKMAEVSINEVTVKKVREFLRANVPYDLPDDSVKP